MSRRALVVCTANVCRSPVAAALLARRIEGVLDLDGEDWIITSAGIADVRVAMAQHTVLAAASAGVDLTGHRRRVLDRSILESDGADLVLTMTREHVRAVIGIDPSAWPRTFTLKELARRSMRIEPPSKAEDLKGWMARVANGRRAAGMMGPDPSDDVADPFGGPQSEHRAMVTEVGLEVEALVRCGPWSA
jgi:protein-tyrosine phosphatase